MSQSERNKMQVIKGLIKQIKDGMIATPDTNTLLERRISVESEYITQAGANFLLEQLLDRFTAGNGIIMEAVWEFTAPNDKGQYTFMYRTVRADLADKSLFTKPGDDGYDACMQRAELPDSMQVVPSADDKIDTALRCIDNLAKAGKEQNKINNRTIDMLEKITGILETHAEHVPNKHGNTVAEMKSLLKSIEDNDKVEDGVKQARDALGRFKSKKDENFANDVKLTMRIDTSQAIKELEKANTLANKFVKNIKDCIKRFNELTPEEQEFAKSLNADEFNKRYGDAVMLSVKATDRLVYIDGKPHNDYEVLDIDTQIARRGKKEMIKMEFDNAMLGCSNYNYRASLFAFINNHLNSEYINKGQLAMLLDRIKKYDVYDDWAESVSDAIAKRDTNEYNKNERNDYCRGNWDVSGDKSKCFYDNTLPADATEWCWTPFIWYLKQIINEMELHQDRLNPKMIELQSNLKSMIDTYAHELVCNGTRTANNVMNVNQKS